MTQRRTRSSAARESTTPWADIASAQISQSTPRNTQSSLRQQAIDTNSRSRKRKFRQTPDTERSARNTKRVVTKSSFLAVGTSQSGSDEPTSSNSRPKCFRISGVPSTWSENDLLDALHSADTSLTSQDYRPSLYPACCGITQTALLNIDIYTEHLQSQSHLQVSESDSRTAALLTIDSHFYNLTPLNVPSGEVVAELVVYVCRRYLQC